MKLEYNVVVVVVFLCSASFKRLNKNDEKKRIARRVKQKKKQ